VILKTAQPLDEIERGLQKAGLRRSGEHGYVLDKPKSGFGLSAAAVGDGLVVISETLDLATGVLQRTQPDPRLAPARRLLDETHGALRAVHTYPAESFDPESGCILGVAGGELFTPGNGDEDLALLLKGEPRASEVTLDDGAQRKDILTKSYRVTDVSRSGQTLSLRVRTAPTASIFDNAATIADGGVQPYLLYRCPGAAAERARRKIAARKPILPPPPGPDRSGSRLETLISNYLAALSTAPNAVRVRCPVQTLPPGTLKLRCTGTRPHGRARYHYTMTVVFQPNRTIKYIDIETFDDRTRTIVTHPGKKPDKPRASGT